LGAFLSCIFRKECEVAGVVCASYPLKNKRNQIGSSILGVTDYSFILSEKGMIVSDTFGRYLLEMFLN
jgi:hypothetical protein